MFWIIVALLVVLIFLVEIGVFVFTLLLIISNISILKSKQTKQGREVLPPCDDVVKMVTDESKDVVNEIASDALKIVDDAKVIAVDVPIEMASEIANDFPSENEEKDK